MAHVSVYVCMYVHVYVYVCVCMCVCVYVYVYVCMCMCVCMYVYHWMAHVCVCMCAICHTFIVHYLTYPRTALNGQPTTALTATEKIASYEEEQHNGYTTPLTPPTTHRNKTPFSFTYTIIDHTPYTPQWLWTPTTYHNEHDKTTPTTPPTIPHSCPGTTPLVQAWWSTWRRYSEGRRRRRQTCHTHTPETTASTSQCGYQISPE